VNKAFLIASGLSENNPLKNEMTSFFDNGLLQLRKIYDL